jgi:hypothetical protein
MKFSIISVLVLVATVASLPAPPAALPVAAAAGPTEIKNDADARTSMNEKPVYKKYGDVTAQLVTEDGQNVDTFIDGKRETTNTAMKGDYIVTGALEERWVVKAAKFPKLYLESTEKPGFFTPQGYIHAFQPKGGDVFIVPTWGGEQSGDSNVWQVIQCNAEGIIGEGEGIYLIAGSAFKKTYEEVKK